MLSIILKEIKQFRWSFNHQKYHYIQNYPSLLIFILKELKQLKMIDSMKKENLKSKENNS